MNEKQANECRTSSLGGSIVGSPAGAGRQPSTILNLAGVSILLVSHLALAPHATADSQGPGCPAEWTAEMPTGATPGVLIPLPASWRSSAADLRLTAHTDRLHFEVSLVDGVGVGTADEQSGLWMVAPTHPEAMLEGGPVRLSASRTGSKCQIDWLIESLEPSPGHTRAVLDALQSRLRRSIEAAQTSDLELAALPVGDHPPRLQLLAVQQQILGRSGFDEGLDGAIRRLTADELGWLDAKLSPLDPRTLESMGNEYPSPENLTATPRGPRELAVVASLEPLRQSTETGRPSKMAIEDAAGLAERMQQANHAGRRLDGAVGTVLNDIALSFTSLGVAPAAVSQLLAAVAAGFHLALKTSIEWDAYLLPIEFTDLELELTKSDWSEEDDATQTSWKRVRASVASRRWDLDLKVYDTLSLIGARGTNSATDLLANILDRPWSQGKPGALSVGPFTWSNVLMEDKGYILLEAVESGTKPVVRSAGPGLLEPINAGHGEARVSVKTQHFGGAGGKTWDTQTVQIDTLQVDTSVISAPTILAADQEGEACATATVTHAKDRRVHWTITGTDVSVSAETEGDGETQVCFAIPKRPRSPAWEDCRKPEGQFDDSYRILVESLADQGPRQKGDPDKLRPPRQASTTLSIPRTLEVEPRPQECLGLTITRFPGCLEWGATRQLEAEGARDLLWSADHGTIDQAGKYSAPSEGSETAIAVRSANDPELHDEVFVRLAERCDCHVSLWVDGAESYTNLNLRANVAIADKLGIPWVALQGMSSRAPILSLWLGFPMQTVRGRLPLYVEPYNYMGLNFPGREYSAHSSAVDLGRSPGYIQIDKLGDGWLHAKVDGRLSDDETGSLVRARMSISMALPPNRCP